jgi:transcriptional regulator with XRE-family HTH domain
MKELRTIIAKNIQSLRTENGLTQLELAEILNYSDKAISKWERAEAIPDVTVLKQIADRFSVSVDYLLEEEHSGALSEAKVRELVKRNHFIIALISVIGVFALATFIFSMLLVVGSAFAPWLVFIYAAPVGSIVALVLNCVWGSKRNTLVIISVLLWTLITATYLSLLVAFDLNFWALFLVGIPSQAIVLVLSGMSRTKNRKGKENRNELDADDASSSEKAE